MSSFWLFLLWCIILTLIILLLVWIMLTNSQYTWVLLKPGVNYAIHGRKYTFPNMNCTGPTYLLLDTHIADLRKLLNFTGHALDSLKVDWFLTGTALLGTERHRSIPMPFDDNMSIGVDDSHRELLFSQDFVNIADDHHLQVNYLHGTSSKNVKMPFSACIRLQLEECPFAMLDIFFWKRVNNDTSVVKLDSWSLPNNIVFNTIEHFSLSDIYPLKKNVVIDDMLVNIPQNPRNVLEKQYGPEVFTEIIAKAPTITSRLFPFMLLRSLWTKIPPR